MKIGNGEEAVDRHPKPEAEAEPEPEDYYQISHLKRNNSFSNNNDNDFCDSDSYSYKKFKDNRSAMDTTTAVLRKSTDSVNTSVSNNNEEEVSGFLFV